MGGIVEGGIGIGTKTSPRRAAIDKAQAELRLEYDIRKERRRELEFLEKGGDPLDFIFRIIDPLSVQSSSLAVQSNDQLGNCETKGGFSSAASPLGDSIGSSGRLGGTVACEPNGADDFDGENEIIESKGKLRYASRSNNTLSEEHSSQLRGGQNVKDSEDSPTFHPKRAYRRRNRSKTNRDSARLGATDISSHGGQNSSLSDRHKVVSEAVVQESPCDTEIDGSIVAFPNNGGLSEGKDMSRSRQNNDHPCDQIDEEDRDLFACSDAGKSEKGVGLDQQREPDQLKGDGKCLQTEGSVDGNADSRLCSMKYIGSIDEQMEQKLSCELTEDEKAKEILKAKKMVDIAESNSCRNDGQSPQICQDQEQTDKSHLSALNENIQPFEEKDSKIGLQQCSLHDSTLNPESHCPKKQEPLSTHEFSETDVCDSQTIVVDKEHEERILEKARNILAKRKVIEDISLGSLPTQYRGKSHWDFVLEEMAWMANDFAQERVWKRTSATQLCYRAAFASRLRFGERDRHKRDKVVARTMAKAVIDFWHSAALLVKVNGNGVDSETCGSGTAISENMDNVSHNKEYVKDNVKLALQGYAVRFLQFNSSAMPIFKDETSLNLDGASTIGTYEMTFQNKHGEEDLFYAVPHGAMERYRNTVERLMVQCPRASKNVQEEDNSSLYNGEFEYQENGYEEDEGENAYYLPGKASKFAEKKRKNLNLYARNSYETVGDLSYGRCIKNNRIRIPQSSVKRPANGIDVCPIPTKRIRTASRQRVVGPFSSGFMCGPHPSSRTDDASSGDTNSFQDDESTVIAKGMEVESGMDYESAFDSAEFTAKPKKKKSKHQRNHFIKRSESHQLDANSNYDPFAPRTKKPKTMKQSLENSIENKSLMSGSVASPAGSQMSNMSNSNKLIKLIGGRDRGRKTKTPKMPSVQAGSGCPWSLFEDQALVVLVHDMGPNWELVSDAISSTLHFKCIFRKPQECKERHAVLLEKSWGDGADTEDSGSSQPYPSTLPGIPKGGARQLFQQLRGPMEEDTIKSHFEKIISIGQKLHTRKKQDPKHRVSMHSSHLAALSQVITNGVNGSILTPLDLCDMVLPTSPDIFSGSYQSPHSGSLPLPNEVSSQPMPPSNNRAMPSTQANFSVRDGRHGISRANLPIDDQQRIQQYKQMLSSRNMHQSNMSVPGNGMSSPSSRPGLQGNSLNMQPRGVPIPRPRDASVMRVPHGNGRGVPSISGSGSSFSTQSASPSGPAYPAQQQHLMHRTHSNAMQQHARERQLQQQRILQRQQQKQLSVSTSSSPVTPAPFQHQQKHQLPRAQPMMPQSGRHHPLQQPKLVMARGNTMNGVVSTSSPVSSTQSRPQQPLITPPNQQPKAVLKLVNQRHPVPSQELPQKKHQYEEQLLKNSSDSKLD